MRETKADIDNASAIMSAFMDAMFPEYGATPTSRLARFDFIIRHPISGTPEGGIECKCYHKLLKVPFMNADKYWHLVDFVKRYRKPMYIAATFQGRLKYWRVRANDPQVYLGENGRADRQDQDQLRTVVYLPAEGWHDLGIDVAVIEHSRNHRPDPGAYAHGKRTAAPD